MSTRCARTWIGLPVEDGPAELGQVRIERWQRQPHRTLLFGTSRSKNGSGQRHLGPGLVAVAAVSKEPAEGGVLCAGVRLTKTDAKRSAAWYCPCDVKITLVGERGDDLTRTVKWVMTPQNSEIFFHMLPLADVEKLYISDSGALRIRAQLLFHFSMQGSSGRPAIFPLGAHGATLQALMYSRCLAGPLKGASRGTSGMNEQAKLGRLEVCRSGVMTSAVHSMAGQSASSMLPVPGLLPPCPELPSAFAQEIIPGLMIASEEALSKLVELHDVGVGTLLQVSRSQCFSRQISEGQSGPGAPLEFEVRLLQLRGCGDTVELVENPVCPSEQAQSAGAVIDLIEEALEAVLSGREGTSYMLVLPREEARDMEPCAALVAVVLARRFQLTFAQSQRYVRTRWDVVITESWAQHLSVDCDLLPAESWTSVFSTPQTSENAESGHLLDELCSSFRQGDTAAAVSGKFALWFEAATASRLSYGRALSWEQTWDPCPGLCVHIYDSGWGSASEVFRAMSTCAQCFKAPMIILRMMSALPTGEIFEVPHRIDSGDDTWHLSALVLTDAHSAGAARPRCVSFLHGAGLWMLDADGHVYEVSRQSHGSTPESWLCTCDMSARAIVYLRNTRPKGKLPLLSNSQVQPTQCSPEEQESVPEGHVAVRIVTEKMLQQADGDFGTSLDISASTTLVLPKGTNFSELQGHVHHSLKIPPGKQLLLHLPDTPSDAPEQRLFPIQEPLTLFSESECITILLMFATDPMTVSVDVPFMVANGSKISLPSKLPLLCKYFDKATLRYVVLGVLLIPPGDSLLHHSDWIKKRVALLMGRSQDQQANSNGRDSAWLPALACCMEMGKPGVTLAVRMDWPLCEQQIGFGSTLVFERTSCGRLAPMPAAKGLEVCGGSGSVISTLIQLVQPAPPVDLLGCVFFDSDVRAHRSKGRCSGEPEIWGLFQRMLSEAIEEQLDIELVSVSKASTAAAEHGSVMVFKIRLDGNMATAGDLAMELCWCFSASETAHRRALCRGRLAKHRPWELFLTAGSARGGARALWHALASGWSDTSAFNTPRAGSPIPAPLLSVLYAIGAPVGDVEVFDVGPDTLDGAEQRAAGRADYNAASLLGPEGLQPPPSRARRKNMESQAEQELPTDSGSCSATDAVDVTFTTEDGDGPQEQRQELIFAEVPDGMGASASETDSIASPCRVSPAPSQSTSAGASCTYNRHKPESLKLEDARLEIECRSFLLVGICYEGHRCKYAHPAGAQLARSDPCPFQSESRDRCPLRICCAFAHGDGERLCPPYIRARGGSCEHSVSSTPGGPASTLPNATALGPQESTASLVKRMLSSSIEQLSAVLAEAKALNLVDEIHETEKQLLSLFLLRGTALPRREAVPRSRAMSRSSSCDSFLDEAAGRDAARLVLALTPGEATQPSTPRSLLHTPAPSPHAAWPENDVSEISAEGSVLQPSAVLQAATLPTASSPAPILPATAPAAATCAPATLPGAGLQSMPGTTPPSPVLPASLPPTAPVSPAMVVPVLPAAALHSAVPPALPIVSWHEPILETSSPSVGASFTDDHPYLEHSASATSAGFRNDSDQQFSRPSRFDRRSSIGMIGAQPSMSNVGFMWHTSPFNISRTPNIRTPVSHCSPARSPTSFSGYCSPITALPSGVTSPTQRRSRSGYSSPSADRSHVGPTFFVGPGTATAQSGLMRRLMSLREAREEKDDDEWSNVEPEPAEKEEGKNLLDFLQEQSQSVSLNRRPRDPPSLCLDLSADFLPYCRRGLAPSRAPHCLNAFLQALLPCSPLMHLFAQLSWHSLTRQRPTYACLVQIAFHFFGGNRVSARSVDERSVETSAAMLGPIDTYVYVDPILRRFERAKGSSAAAQPGKGPTETLTGFVHFLLSELHNECKWPMLSPNASQYEDSPINRIFGGILRKGPLEEDTATPVDFGCLMDSENSDVEPFLVLHLDLTGDPCASVAEATQQNLLRGVGAGATGSFSRGVHSALHFERLPPFLLVHLQRFRTVNGVPTRVSRHCHIDMRLELEEAAHCTLRTVCYELCSLVCHYGEAPEGGTYKAMARQGGKKSNSAGPAFVTPTSTGLSSPFAAAGNAAGAGYGPAAFSGDWYVFDDTAVRLKPAEELASVLQCEGFQVCFLMYRREDTKTINIRPHAF